MKTWTWLAIGAATAYFYFRSRNGKAFTPLPQSQPGDEFDPFTSDAVAGYDDPGKRLAEQLWGYSIVPDANNVSYKGSH